MRDALDGLPGLGRSRSSTSVAVQIEDAPPPGEDDLYGLYEGPALGDDPTGFLPPIDHALPPAARRRLRRRPGRARGARCGSPWSTSSPTASASTRSGSTSSVTARRPTFHSAAACAIMLPPVGPGDNAREDHGDEALEQPAHHGRGRAAATVGQGEHGLLQVERARPPLRARRPAHRRGRGGVHAPRRDEVRPAEQDRAGPAGRRRAAPIAGPGAPRADGEHRRGREQGLPQHRRRPPRALRAAPRPRRRRRPARPADRRRRHPPVLARRGPADHLARPLPLHRRAAAVRRPPRARLRDAHPRRRARARDRA